MQGRHERGAEKMRGDDERHQLLGDWFKVYMTDDENDAKRDMAYMACPPGLSDIY